MQSERSRCNLKVRDTIQVESWWDLKVQVEFQGDAVLNSKREVRAILN